MPNRLSDLEVLEVSLVPRGANGRKFLLLKEEVNGMDLEEIYEVIAMANAEGEEALDELVKAGLSEKAINAVKGALRLLSAYKDELPKDILETLAGIAGYGYPAPEVEKSATESKVMKDDGSLDLAAVPEDLRPAIESLWKDREESLRKVQELEAVIKAEHDRQLTKEFVAKAGEFRNLAIRPEDLGPVLKRISEASAEDYKLVESVLKAANEALEANRLLDEIGSGVAMSGSAGQLDARAKELTQKSNISYEQAVDRILQENPELYTQYLTERQ